MTAAAPSRRDPFAVLDAVWRAESARIVAGVARVVRDVGQAEELAHDALVAALEQWPAEGVPDNPGAWLAATARRRAIDTIRREQTFARKAEEVGRAEAHRVAPDAADVVADPTRTVGDDVLALLFATCHPDLARESRVALTLRLFGGLTTDEIARGLLVASTTVGQRISRAKKRLSAQGVELEIPSAEDLPARLGAVLEVVYLVFNEGYSATAGADWVRHDLCDEAMRLGRRLAALLPDRAEVHGLLALMELQASRLRARTGPDGRPVLLADQDRGRWDRLLVGRGLAGLDRARALGGADAYTLQAAIAAEHARARSVAATDWARLAELYGELSALSGSPVVELNRAVVVGKASGPGAALAIVDGLREDPALARYHLLPAVRADLLVQLDRPDDAAVELERAAELASNQAERDLLRRRLEDLREASLGGRA
ncbi:sigma-70 family RNA polymerase sigma factor [Actinomycetospora sp. NBRC 106378]|uniref:RNA polymerase sigma factor n=1 Tax=Actinomycetospora sp. NBRC 106378 TaxID=3032208 RepID=UPI0024A5AD8D|nr:sigma-70 family RNA polymerase sigma factor [Actinomycetospora sp. NBRC 106378]GLZ52215.1 RNA polymerase subunit sigma-24 [Actinomycetospora sp. NBRC 106378]